MSFWPVPDVMKNSIYEITPRMFTNRGIRFILIDIDNTVAPYTIASATERMKAWVENLKNAGLEVFVLSNNRGERPESFARELNISFLKGAKKPFTKAAKAVIAEHGYTTEQTAFIGDQIYTDTACAKWCGCFCVLVHPIEFNRFILRFRYWLEFPFRLKCRWKDMK